jgi:outer membrane murein-binding lipoprotein Lpp
MPRTSSPTNLKDSQLIISIKQEIENKNWLSVRDSVVEAYQQRLSEIEQKRGQLSEEEFKKKRFKRLSETELMTLALCFLSRLIELNKNKTDTEDTIASLCEAETALLEQGYPKETIAKNHHGIYLNLIREAIASRQLPLNQQNSYSFDIIKQDTGQKETIQQHYAQLYLKYDPEDYLSFKKDGKGRNNIKQDKPQPIILPKYIDKVNQLLQSDSYTELAVGIAAATGRRFSEVMQRGTISLPENLGSEYKFLFEGQLKKNQAQSYLTYSLVPSSVVVEAISRFRELPKIKELEGASIKKINTLTNPTVNYQVKRHFQDTGIISVLESEQAVTVQNLRGAYGAIATHFFCPSLAQFPRFLSSSLGHLIGSELSDRSLSSSTEHYFHYYLVNGNLERMTELGVKLSGTSSIVGTTPLQEEKSDDYKGAVKAQGLLSDAAKTKTPTLKQENEPNYLKVVIDLLESENIWAKVTGLVAVTGLMPNLLLQQLFFKEVKANNLILYRDQLHSLNTPLNRLVTLVDAQIVMETIVLLRASEEIQSIKLHKTGNEFNACVSGYAKEYLITMGVDSFNELVEQYLSFLPSAPEIEKGKMEVKDTSALIHTYTSTRTEFDRLMAQLGTETQHETLVKIIELANVVLDNEANPVQNALESQKDTEIAQLKEILISKDKEINQLSKAITSFESEVTQLQTEITEAKTTIALFKTASSEAQQAHTELETKTDQLQDQVQKLRDLLFEKEQTIATLQTDLANSSVLVNEQSAIIDSHKSEPLSESAQLTQAMLTLTSVITKLSDQLSTKEKTEPNLNYRGSSQESEIKQVAPVNRANKSQKTITKRSRSKKNEQIEKAIAFVMQHNLNSSHEERWMISFPVLADLLGTSLTPITAFFNNEENQQLVKEVAQHHQDLGLTNNTHNRSYHPKQKITQFLKLPD